VVKARSWTPLWRECRDTSPIEYFYVTPTARRGTHRYSCTGGVPWNLDPTGTRDPWGYRSLGTGHSISTGAFTCRGLWPSTISCVNRSGHGFSVGRERFRLF
jgi:hypothetical protein